MVANRPISPKSSVISAERQKHLRGGIARRSEKNRGLNRSIRLYVSGDIQFRLGCDFLKSPESKKLLPANLVLFVGGGATYYFFPDFRWLRDRGLSMLAKELEKAGICGDTKRDALSQMGMAIDKAAQEQPFSEFPAARDFWKEPVRKERAEPVRPHRHLPCPEWLSKTVWAAIVKRENRACICCLAPLSVESGASAHHLLPRSEGGESTEDNLVLICHACHDKLEQAQESGLFATNHPPRRSQLVGIHQRVGRAIPPVTTHVFGMKEKRAGAERVLRDYPPHRLAVLCGLGKRDGRWMHVDWDYVSDALAVRK